jgi:S1-C subfamily serine protease
VVPQLIARGKYIRPSLGISVDADINRAVTGRLGIKGVLVLKVDPGSAAEAAGLRGTRVNSQGDVIPGDIIQAMDGKPVDSVSAYQSALDQYHVGDRVTLRIWRSGRELKVPVLLQAGS